MDIEEQQVKDCLKDYLLARVDNLKRFRCLNPLHKDSNPSATYYENSNLVYCYSCRKHYDIFNLIAFEYDLDNKEAYKKGFELYGTKKLYSNNYSANKRDEYIKSEQNLSKDFEKWHNSLLQSGDAKSYLFSRGITQLSIDKFNLGFNEERKMIVIPTSNYSFNSRNIKEKIFFKFGSSNIFNKSALYNNKTYCIITESEFDCMSFAECGCNAIGLGGIGLIKKFLQEDLSKDKTYLLALDNDEAGQSATTELSEELKARNLRFLALNYGNPYKDPNEALTHNFEGFNKVCESIKLRFDK